MLGTSDIQRTICSELHALKTIKKFTNLDAKARAKLNVAPFDNTEPRKYTSFSNDSTNTAAMAVTNATSTTNVGKMMTNFKDVRSNKSNNNIDNSATSNTVITSTESNLNFVSIPTSSSINNNNNSNVNNNSADLASVDSTDTFMSCQTHPFLSQGDLSEAFDENKFNLDDFNSESLYMNSMEISGIVYKYGVNKLDRSVQEKIKKSSSGDVGSNNLLTNSMEEYFSGSHVSLDDSPIPKHQKMRLSQQKQQQLITNNLRLKSSFEGMKETFKSIDSGSSTDRSSNTIVSDASEPKKSRKSSSFYPSKMITNATKQLINQHLFGLQSKGFDLSLFFHFYCSLFYELWFISDGSNGHHRRSKSILKNKSDVRFSDPESEGLLSDTGSGVSENSVIPVSFVNEI